MDDRLINEYFEAVAEKQRLKSALYKAIRKEKELFTKAVKGILGWTEEDFVTLQDGKKAFVLDVIGSISRSGHCLTLSRVDVATVTKSGTLSKNRRYIYSDFDKIKLADQ